MRAAVRFWRSPRWPLALGACNRTHGGAKVAIPAATSGRRPARRWPPASGASACRAARASASPRYCLDAGAASALASFNQQLSGRCSERQMALGADGAWRFCTACDMGAAGKVVTEGVMRGDFASHYVVEAPAAEASATSRHVDRRRASDSATARTT